jgi:hypothetical protein
MVFLCWFSSYPTFLRELQILLLKVVIFRNELIIFKSLEVLFSQNLLKKGLYKDGGGIGRDACSARIPTDTSFFSCKMSLQFINVIYGETVSWLVGF